MVKMRKIMIEIIFLTVLLIGVFIYRRSNNIDEKEIMKNGELAIGVVDAVGQVGWYSNGNIRFSFYSDNQKIIKPLSSEPVNIKVQREERYLVIYLPSNKKKALMLYGYPIKDSSDFKQYVKEFKQKRKQNIKE